MVTKEQAMEADYFHLDNCKRIIGTRGGVKEHKTEFRRNGQTQTWKTRPNDFKVPIKYGMRDYGYLTQDNADRFHTSTDCPLLDHEFVTQDNRRTKDANPY